MKKIEHNSTLFPHFATLILFLTLFALISLDSFAKSHSFAASSAAPNGKPQSSLNFMAFNVQSFGRYKMSKPFVRKHLTKILSSAHVSLVQEIRDKSQVSIHQLHEQLKTYSGKNYEMALSKRLGKSTHKEQLAFFFDADRLELINSRELNDPFSFFHREPYVARFLEKKSGKELVVVGAHFSPQNVRRALEGLEYYTTRLLNKSPSANLLIMGDLNADCDYISEEELTNSRLRSPKYRWWISDDVDTTTSSTDCAYDRLITSNHLARYVSGRRPRAVNFQQELGLTLDQALDISDHYPVVIEFSF